MRQINQIDKANRPREKLARLGPEALSDTELLATILGTGSKQTGVMTLSSQLLKLIHRSNLKKANYKLQLNDLKSLPGIGSRKASLILASLEFSRRLLHPKNKKINSAADAFSLIASHASSKQESLLSISLNGASEVLDYRVVTIGILNRTLAHPREVYAEVIMDRAAGLIIAHNHPSGCLEPSKEDIKVTKQLAAAGEILGIKLYDHLIFNHSNFYSFQENGLLN